MVKRSFPENRAIEVANESVEVCLERYPKVFLNEDFHSLSYLRSLCDRIGVRLLEKKFIPGKKRKAMAMDVEGEIFIILDPILENNPSEKLFALAHELSHVILRHMERPNYALCGYSETMQKGGYRLQELYCLETELEAELASFFLVMTDKYLESVVEKNVFIPTRRIARETSLELGRVTARVQLFRKMHGYDRTLELLEVKLANDEKISLGVKTPEEWLSSVENTNSDYLGNFLPKVDMTIFSMIS